METQEEWAARYRKKFAQYEVPSEEREQLIAEGEVGKYPGDEDLLPRVEKSGQKEFDQLKRQRLDLTDQVKQARQRQKELHPYPKIERFADKVLGYVPGILSPDVPKSETETPEAPTKSPATNTPSFATPTDGKPSRFAVEEGEIVDTKNRQIVSPGEFNRLSTPQEKDDIAAKLKEGGYLADEPPGPQRKPVSPTPTTLADEPVDLEIPPVHVVGERPQQPNGPRSIINQFMDDASQFANDLRTAPSPKSMGEAFTESVNNYLQGLAGIPSSALKSIAIASKSLDDLVPNSVRDDRPIEERATYKLGQSIDTLAKQLFPTNPELQKNFFVGVLPRALGSMTGFLGGAAVGTLAKAPLTAGGMLGAQVGGTEQYEDAKQHGASDAVKQKAFWLGSAVGVSEIAPVGALLNRFDKATGGGFFKVLKEGGVTAAQEFIQEYFQQAGNNIIAQQLYDENRSWLGGTLESGSAGGVSGALTGLLSGILQGRKARKQERLKEGGSSEAPFAGEPTPPPQPQAPPQPATPDLVGTIPGSLNIAKTQPFLVKKFPSPMRPAPEVVPGMQAPQPATAPSEPVPAPLPTAPAPSMEPPPIVPAPQAAAAPEPLPGEDLPTEQPPTPLTDETASEAIAPNIAPNSAEIAPTPESVLETQAHEAATSPTNDLPEPTEGQKEAGNYKKGHVRIAGLDISIENPQGSVRSGVDKTGKPWEQEMQSHYGYIKGTVGKDKDHLDVFIKPGTPEDYDGTVYIVDQNNPGTKNFDEHKIILGANDMQDAKQLYRENYAKDWDGLWAISAQPMKDFKEWLKSGDTKKPFLRDRRLEPSPAPEQVPSLTPPRQNVNHVLADLHDYYQRKELTDAAKKQAQALADMAESIANQDGDHVTHEQRRNLRLNAKKVRDRLSERVPNPPVPHESSKTPSDQAMENVAAYDQKTFDYTVKGKRPTVKQILGDWKQAGRPKEFNVVFGESHATFRYEDLHGIPQWWDEGNGARGIDRNKVLDALKAEQFHAEQTETPPTPESVSTASAPVKPQPTKAPQSTKPELPASSESPSRQQAEKAPAPTPEQVARPQVQKPRSELHPKENAEMLLHAEKAQADLDTQQGSGSDVSLIEFLRSKGGVQDQGGELSHLGVDAERKPFVKKLIQAGGLTLDQAAEMAHEAGYLQDRSIADLLSALDRETRGKGAIRSDWYRELTTGPRPLTREQIETAIQKIIKDDGVDVGKAVERVKAALLQDREFDKTPWGKDADAIMRGEWPSWIERPVEPFALSTQEPKQNPRHTNALEQLGIEVPPETIGSRPIIGREATPDEAPLFSKDAQTPNAEQTSLLNHPTPEAVTAPKKPDTISVTPEEVPHAKPQRTRAEDTSTPAAIPTEAVSEPPGDRQTEGVRAERADASRGGPEQPGGKRPAPGRSNGDNERADLPAERGGSSEPERDHAAVSGPAGVDYVLPENYEIPTGQKGKFKANVAAIKLLKQLEAEGRLATPEEQATLAKYTGWGGLPQAFEWSRNWDQEYGQLRELLTEDDYKAARASTPNAHYTDPSTIRAIYTGLEHLGFKGGRVLEPGAGVGHFFGSMPESLSRRSTRTAIELDSLSARIAKQLYQRANVIQNEYQKVPLPKDFFDVAVGNVPFADVKVFDPNDKDLNKLNLSLHDYYFAKAISQVRPGGIVAFITSRYTMDKVNGKLRDYLSKQADLLGAIRLPNTQFKDIANTEVTTDIIVLQKREPDTAYGGHPWATVKPISTADGEVTANEYFAAHPEQIMGKLSLQGSMYRDKEPTVQADGRDMATALKEAFSKLPQSVMRPRPRPTSSTSRGLLESLQATDDVKNGAYTIQNNALYVREGDKFIPVEDATPTDLERAKGLIGLREQVREVFKTQLANDSEQAITAARKELNARYDKFVKKWGPINGRTNKSLFRTDPDYSTLQALEKDFDPKTQKAKKADIFSKRVIEYRAKVTTAGSPKEALLASMNETGTIDWDRMAELTGQPPQEMQSALKGVVYQDPAGGWDMAANYLSGNVRQKLKAAREAAKIDPRYQENVEALEQIIPEDLKPDQIHMKMGHGWVPTDVYEGFIAHLLQTNERNTIVKYNAQVGSYSVTLPKFIDRTRNVTTFGTERYPAQELIHDALHSTMPTVYDRTSDDKRVVNEKETLAAREKLEAIQEEFRKWVWQDPKRTERLARLYNDEFNSVVETKYDGSHLTLPGANPLITLRPHQKNVIWRALQSGNTLLAHVVGAGKTFAMVGIALESRRLRLANKPMIAVPNHLVEQWRDDVLALYPSAKVLMTTKEDFEAANRKRLAGRIATGNWDLIVIAHSQLSRIPISLESFEQFVNEQVEILEDYIREAKAENGKQSRNLTKELEKAKKRLQSKLERRKAEVAERADNAVNFEETGVDMLLIDEAHLFKNLWFPTRMTRVAGLPNSESQRAYDLLLKTQYLNKVTKNRGVIFATGTPISNSMSEVFTMQRYLQPQALEHAGLTHFDAWARQFGNVVLSTELSPDGSGYRQRSRFAEFVNVPELTQMFRQVMDVRSQDELKLPVPNIRTGKPINVVAKPSEALKAYTMDLIKRAERIKHGVDPRIDNMLKITTDGRNAALDVRLRVPDAAEDKNGKVAMAVNNIVEDWKKFKAVKGTQLLFLDLSTPKSEKVTEEEPAVDTDTDLGEEVALRGSVYQDIKRKLVKRGIPEKEIAFIHEAKTNAQKSDLFAKVNAGEVRVLLASTGKAGAGTNVQQRLTAVHSLDSPWKPAEIEQREGRGIRQGNLLHEFRQHLEKGEPLDSSPSIREFADHKDLLRDFEVGVFRYATEAPSFDVYMWQTLESKAKSINQVMKGDPSIRSIQDMDVNTISYAEMKAIASGNPLIKERMTLDIELHKLKLLNSQYKNSLASSKYELATSIPSSIAFYKNQASEYKQDKQMRDANPIEPFSATIDDVTYTDEEAAGKAILQFVKDAASSKRTEGTKLILGTFRGFNLGLSIFLDGDANITLSRVAGKDAHRTSSFNQDANPAGLIDRMNNALNKIDAEIENAERILAQKVKRQEELQAEVNKPFEKAARLKELEAKLAKIDKELDLTNKDEGIIAAPEGPEPTPAEPPKPGVLDKLMEERGSFTLGGRPKYTKEAERYRQQRIKEEIGFMSSDADIEVRVRQAKKGVQPASLYDRMKDHVRDVWHLISREFEHLPDTAQFSVLRNDLLKLEKYKGIAADKIQRELAAIIKPLDRKQYDQLEWKALLADLAREAEQGHALPFGYTPEQVRDDLDRLNEIIERDPKVQDAWDKRQKLWGKLKADYKDAMEAIGFDVSKKLTKQDYFRHQVLEHARQGAVSGAGSRIRTPTGRGFLKTRKGSSYDINANYVQAEFEVMAQMVYDTQLAKVIQGVDKHLNIRDQLKQEAKVRNREALTALIEESGEAGDVIESQLKDFKNRIGMHMAMLKKALELEKDDELPMSQIADIAEDQEAAGNLSARGVLKAINERKAYIEGLLGPKHVTWDKLIPETHEIWQPREGNVFYMADSIPAQLAKALQESMLAEAGIPVDKLRKVLAMGGAREEYVIPKEAATTLNDLSRPEPNWFIRFNKQVLGHWKQLMLVAPRRILRYNVRNLTGDADALFVGNPSAFKKLPQAAKDLLPVIFKDEKLTGEAKAWVERGGYGTTLQFQELGDLNDLKAFRHTLDRASKGGILSIPAKAWNSYWKAARLSTDYREAMMRYAAYLDYLGQMQRNNGRPKNFGASRPETVMALPDIRDRAFKLSNELLGAYDRVSHAGKTIRNFWIPFYSWMEVNATRYFRMVNNALNGGNGGQLRRGALITTKQAAGFMIRLSAMWSLLQAWNYLMFPDDEDELKDANPTVANRPHILFGRDENGKIQYLSGVGALGDLLSWFGLDAFPGLVGDIMHDRLTIGEAIQNAAKAPINKLWQGITPTVKMPVELTLRESTYPDVFRPRPINDRGDYLGNQTTFGPEINALREKPGKPLYGVEDLTGLLIQRADPKSSAYGTWGGIERKYLERMGKDSSQIFWRSPRGEALSNWGRAIAEKDQDAISTWKGEYEKLEREKYGTKFSRTKMMHDIEQSLRTKAPLAGVSTSERAAIMAQLDAKEKRTLKLAEQYYRDTIMQVLPPDRRYSFEHKLERQGWLEPDSGLTPDSLY